MRILVKICRFGVWIFVFVCLFGMPCSSEELETAGALHLEGNQIKAENGENVQLRGVSTHGLAWFPQYVNEACFRQLRQEWNVNVIRLAMYTAESGGYCTDGDQLQLKELVKAGVAYATRQDLYVIIDWHILSDGNPQMYMEDAKSFFAEMSESFGEQNNVIYEICNEPNGGTTWAQIKSYAMEIIPVIRERDPDALILVGTPNWSQYINEAIQDPITGYDNIMYTLHFYAATHKEDLRNQMKNAAEQGFPVFVSEYGICDASGSGAIDGEQARLWIETMDELGISYVAWNLSNKDETSSMLLPSCEKTSNFTESDLSASGRWIYQMLQDETADPSSEDTDPEKSNGDAAAILSAGEADQRAEDGSGLQGDSDAEETVFQYGEIEVHLTLQNRWVSNGILYRQFNTVLHNRSEQPMDSWEIELEFEEVFEIQDGWNGEYKKSGTVLQISSKDYNGKMDPGGTVQDVGFILAGGGEAVHGS